MSTTVVTAAITYSNSQLARRVQLDPDIPDMVKNNIAIVFAVCRRYWFDYIRTREFTPAIGYDDILQEVLWYFVHQLPIDYKPERDNNFAAFCFTALLRHIQHLKGWDKWDKGDRGERTDLHGKRRQAQIYVKPLQDWMASDQLLTADAVIEMENMLAVRRFLERLTKQQQVIFNLRWQEEMLMVEIAQELGVHKGTITKELQRIQAKYLECALEECLPLPKGVFLEDKVYVEQGGAT